MDIISYALCKKIAEHAVSGVQSMSIEGQNLIINTKDSGVLTMTFPTPKDGVSVTDIDVNANNQIVFTMSDGSEIISGKIPTVKGEPGFSPTITENADNTDKIYKLDITTADSTFTTPNLKGADGQGGTGGDSSVTLTQEEYEALTEEEKLNGLYYIYDTKRIYKNGVQYGASEPISLTMAEYKALKEAGAIDEQQEYLIEADDEGILLNAEDIGYSNAKSGIQATTVQDAIDKIAESGGSGEKNVQSDWNETDDTADGFIKNKPTIPEAYDDTALSNRVKTIEDNYAKSSDIPSLSEYATETWVNEQGFLTQHQDLSNYATKDEIPTVPSKVSELTNDSNYQTAEQVNSIVTTEIAKVVADAPEDFDTLKEMSDWIAGHEDDASAMNSAISDNKTAITALQIGKADKSEIPTTVAELTDSSDYAKITDLHSHTNKIVLDGITSTKVSNWDAAKAHADSAHARTDATKVEKSSTNGNIKINGTETTVYTHPSGTNPHGTTKSDVGLSNVPNVSTNNQTPTFTKADRRDLPISGETLSTLFGKILKWLSDLKSVAFTGDYTDLSNQPTNATTSTNGLMSKDDKLIVDRLNRESLSLVPRGTDIGANQNLNTINFIKVGKYHCSTNATVQTLTNCPTTEAFMMEVFSPLSTTYDNETTSQWVYRLRKITTNTGHMYIQKVNSGSTAGTFTYDTWHKMYSELDKPVNTWIAFKGATATSNGTAGYIPAPTMGNQDKFFRADGTWATLSLTWNE